MHMQRGRIVGLKFQTSLVMLKNSSPISAEDTHTSKGMKGSYAVLKISIVENANVSARY
jgi:hypothetical protein